MKPIEPGERIHLVNLRKKYYVITLKRDGVFKFSGETLHHNELISQLEGITVKTSRGTPFIALRPTLAEYVLKMPRGAQIIYPKELGMILLWADIYQGATVLEAGLGSGALTLALLRAVGEKGRVISYEIREDFMNRALENINQFHGKPDNHIVRPLDIYQGIEDGPVDRLLLDLPEPWRVIPYLEEVIRPGGIFLSLSPTVPQVERVVSGLQNTGYFAFIETFETLLRHWNIDGRSVRPDHRMVAHTAFLTVARKVLRPSDPKEKELMT